MHKDVARQGRARMRTSARGPGRPWAGSRGAKKDGEGNVARVMERGMRL